MHVVHNMIDSPSKYSGVEGTPVAVLTFQYSIDSFDADTIDFTTRNGEHISLAVTDINKGLRKITVLGERVMELNNSGSFSYPSLSANSFEVTVAPVSGYFDESGNGGSVYSKWISKLFILDQESDGIEVRLSSILYKGSTLRVYYKAKNSGIDSDFSQINWTPFNKFAVKPDEIQRQLFQGKASVGQEYRSQVNSSKLAVTPGLADNIEKVKLRSSVNVDPRKIISDEWQTLIFSVQDIFKFDAVLIKVVMEAHNPALTPIIDDIQIICTE